MKLSAQHMTGEDQRPKPASIAARFGGWAARRMRVGFLGLLLPAAIALPLGIMAGGAWITWQSVWRSAEAELASTADAAAEYAQRVLEGHRLRAALVDQLLDGRSDAEIRSREAELHRNLRALIEQHQPDGAPPPILVVYGREGRPLLSSTIYPVVPADYTDREFFRVMAAPGAPPVHVGEVVEGRASQRLLFPLSVRREATGDGPLRAFAGVINVAIQPEEAAAGLQRLASKPGDVISLVREDAALLASTLPLDGALPRRLPLDSPIAAGMRQGNGTALKEGRSARDGKQRLAAFRRVGGGIRLRRRGTGSVGDRGAVAGADGGTARHRPGGHRLPRRTGVPRAAQAA